MRRRSLGAVLAGAAAVLFGAILTGSSAPAQVQPALPYAIAVSRPLAPASTGAAEPGATASAGAASGQLSPATPAPSSYGPITITSADVNAVAGSSDSDGPAVKPTLRPGPPSEFQTFVSATLGRPLPRFGSSLLLDSNNGFAVPSTAAIPRGYTLNPGDELVIRIAGSIEAPDLHVVIDSEGRIFIPRIGSIAVAGVRYGDIEDLLRTRLGHEFRDFHLSVAMGRLHGLRVYVTGYAARPGSYTVSSLSTLVNGILAAGGPSTSGSFRSIELRRNGRTIANLDLYDLLLKGDKTSDVALQNEDVIYIAPSGPEVAMVGSVNAEEIYEMKAGESLRDILAYAGGMNSVADDQRLLVAKLSTADSVAWEELDMAAATATPIERGEIVRVLSAVEVAHPVERQAVLATIDGEVVHPGQYYMKPGSTLGDLVARAGGLMPKAFVYGSVFGRASLSVQQQAAFAHAMQDLQFAAAASTLTSTRDDGADGPARAAAVSSIISQLGARKPDGRLVLAVSPNSDALPDSLMLENNDHLRVPPRPVSVGVAGAVDQPGSYLYSEGQSLKDILELAGGPQRVADRGQIFVVRANGSVMKAHGGLFGGDALSQKALPGDLIVVPVRTAPSRLWTALRDATQPIYQAGLAAATVKYVTQ